MFYRLILNVVHKFIDVLYYIRLVFRDIFLFIQRCVSLLPDFLQTQNSVKQTWFKKLPLHLGIHHVSIYDSAGFVKSNGNQLCKVANNRKHLLLKKQACSLNIIFTNGKVPYLYNTIVKNGHKTEDVSVYLLSHEDGKQEIIQAAKTICKEAKRKPEILEKFHAQHFDHYLKDILNIPDPELVILFGNTKGLMGYLPWHIRLTEIIFQPTHHNFSLEEFHKVLSRYSKCEQRFGK